MVRGPSSRDAGVSYYAELGRVCRYRIGFYSFLSLRDSALAHESEAGLLILSGAPRDSPWAFKYTGAIPAAD